MDFKITLEVKTKLVALAIFFVVTEAIGQSPFEVVGLCIASPKQDGVDRFVEFVDKELAPSGVNTLVLRVDYNYAYTSRPELRGDNPLTKDDVKKLVSVCKKNDIQVIPQINLLGHQSWHSKPSKLLEVYPEFDETPHVELPEEYEWPNEDGLYCKSYCPLHPEVHGVVFELVDEILEVFEATAFHAGMDEVFYLANEKCPRCSGKDPAKLFADEVNIINDHLEKQGARLWIWGDRLLDGESTGIGMWEASTNNTAAAIDLISKNVVINDWHYERADPTPAYFAVKGFDVIACPWRKPQVAKDQVIMMNTLKENSTQTMKSHFLGTMQTIWSSAEGFMDNYYDKVPENMEKGSQVESFKSMIREVRELQVTDSTH